MGWKDYFNTGFGNSDVGSTYVSLVDLLGDYQKSREYQTSYTVTNYYRKHVGYHCARPGKRWK